MYLFCRRDTIVQIADSVADSINDTRDLHFVKYLLQHLHIKLMLLDTKKKHVDIIFNEDMAVILKECNSSRVQLVQQVMVLYCHNSFKYISFLNTTAV